MPISAQWPMLVMSVALVGFVLLLIEHFRGPPLAALGMLEGERILLERDGLTFWISRTFETDSLRFHGFVRITDRRLVIGSGRLERKLARVHFVVLLDGCGFGGGILDDRYITFPARRTGVSCQTTTVGIQTSAGLSGFEIPHSIEIFTDTSGDSAAIHSAIVKRS